MEPENTTTAARASGQRKAPAAVRRSAPEDPNAPVRSFGPRKFEEMKARHIAQSANEHVGGFNYWHFIDLSTDIVRAAIERIPTVSHYLPWAKTACRVLPVVGVAAETVHVWSPFQRAKTDWEQGKLSTGKYSALFFGYAVYAASGALGIATVAIKEVAMSGLQKYDVIPSRYIPHTLSQDAKHAPFSAVADSALGTLRPLPTPTAAPRSPHKKMTALGDSRPFL